jgi:hypothetical protein
LPPMPGVVLSDDGVGAAVGSPVGDDVGVWVGGHMHSVVGDVLPSPMPMPGDEDDDDDDDDAEPPPLGVTVRPCRASGDSPDASPGRADVGTGASAAATVHATTQQKRRRVVVGTDRAMVLRRVQPKRCVRAYVETTVRRNPWVRSGSKKCERTTAVIGLRARVA